MKFRGSGTRILIYSSFTLPETAGSGIHALRFANYINNLGDTASVLTLNRNLQFKSREFFDGVPVHRIPYFNRNVILKVLSIPIILPYLFQAVNKNQLIIIYGGKTYGFELVIFLSKLLRKKVVFQSLLIQVDDIEQLIIKRKWFGKTLYKFIFKQITLYWSINNEFTKHYYSVFPEKENCLNLAQGVDISVFYPVNKAEKELLRKKLNLVVDKPILISIGFLISRKGFLEIVDQLKLVNYDFQYYIITDANIHESHFLFSEGEGIQRAMREGKEILKHKIEFIPFTNNIQEYIQSADIIIMNSKQEGLPNVLLESMACGLPVISGQITGITKSVLRSELVTLFNTPFELPVLLDDFFTNREKYNQRANRACNEIKLNFSFNAIYPRLLKACGIEPETSI